MLPFESINNIHLARVARIETPPAAIFYTLIKQGDGKFDAFYRCRYDEQVLGRCIIDPKTWTIIQDSGPVCAGEDPRSFSHRGVDYVVDNSLGGGSLIVPNEGYKRCKLPSKGKNLSLISCGSTLLCIEWLKPLSVLSTTESPYPETWKRIKQGRADPDYSFRGGTPGYETPAPGVFIGFGHRTIIENGVVQHTPFAWRLAAEPGVSVSTAPVEGNFDRAITDPTCVIDHDGRLFLVTAESHGPWFGDMQEFFTCIYEIQSKC